MCNIHQYLQPKSLLKTNRILTEIFFPSWIKVTLGHNVVTSDSCCKWKWLLQPRIYSKGCKKLSAETKFACNQSFCYQLFTIIIQSQRLNCCFAVLICTVLNSPLKALMERSCFLYSYSQKSQIYIIWAAKHDIPLECQSLLHEV